MKIEVNIKKKYFYVLVALIVALIGSVIITAQVITNWPTAPASGAWHGADEVGIDTAPFTLGGVGDGTAETSLQDWVVRCELEGGCGGGGGGGAEAGAIWIRQISQVEFSPLHNWGEGNPSWEVRTFTVDESNVRDSIPYYATDVRIVRLKDWESIVPSTGDESFNADWTTSNTVEYSCSGSRSGLCTYPNGHIDKAEINNFVATPHDSGIGASSVSFKVGTNWPHCCSVSPDDGIKFNIVYDYKVEYGSY